MDERHAANRLHAFGTKNVHDFTRVTVQFGAARKTRQPGGDGAARGRVFQGNNGVRLEDVLVGRKIEGVNSQCFRGGIKQGQAGVVVVNDALEAGNDAREKFGEFAARNQDVVDFEQHAETVALTRQLLLVGLRRFQIQRIVHRYRYLTGDALHELEFRVGDALRNGVPETHGPEPVLCRGQRNNRHGADTVSTQPLREIGEARLLLQIANHVWLLVLPNPAGRRILDGHFTTGVFLDRDTSFKNVQAHHVLGRVVKNQSQEVKIDDRVQARSKVVEQRGKIALLGDGLAHLEQGFELTPGVLQRGGMRHFRRRNNALRHKRQDNTRVSEGSTKARGRRAFRSRRPVAGFFLCIRLAATQSFRA